MNNEKHIFVEKMMVVWETFNIVDKLEPSKSKSVKFELARR